MPHKIAFYPCCRSDIDEPLRLLQGFADEVIFCDVNPRLRARCARVRRERGDRSPVPGCVVGDARAEIPGLERIDMLFYRRDGDGEGGSGVFVLGDSILPTILSKFPTDGGLIITDGSNSRDGNFDAMIAKGGLRKHGWRFERATEQPFLAEHGLYIIKVTPDSASEGLDRRRFAGAARSM